MTENPEVNNGYRRGELHSYKARINQNRTFTERISDMLTSRFGTFGFLFINILLFGLWIATNSGMFSEELVFDPFPFNLLTMVVSLEAILLSIIVLMSQNRDSKISDIRAEIDTQIDIVSEEEITKILELLVKLIEKNGIDISKDEKLKKMLKPVDRSYLERKFEQEVGEEA